MSESDLVRVILFIARAKDIKESERSCAQSPNDTQNERYYYLLLPPPFHSFKRELYMIGVSPLSLAIMDKEYHWRRYEIKRSNWFEHDLINSTDDNGEGVDIIELLLEVHPRSDKLKFYTTEENKSTVRNIFTSSAFIVESIDQSQFKNRSFLWAGDPVVFKVFELAIYIMLWRRKSTVFQQLLELGADMKAIGCDPDGRTLLHHAAKLGVAHAVNLLVRHGADYVNARCFCGKTPLYNAAERGYPDAVAALIAAGASADTRDDFGRSALTAACLYKRLLHPPEAIALWKKHANQDALVKKEIQSQQAEVVKLLCEFGARAEQLTSVEWRDLWANAESICDDVLQILVVYNFDVRIYDSDSLPTYVDEDVLKRLSKFGDCHVLSDGPEYIELLQRWFMNLRLGQWNFPHASETLSYILQYNAKFLKLEVINSSLKEDLMDFRETAGRDKFCDILIRINLVYLETIHPVQYILNDIPNSFLPFFNSRCLRDWLRNYIERDGAKLVKDCLAELLVLKDTHIGGSPSTLYDFLTKDHNHLATFAKPLDCSLKFPYYGRIIEYQHQKSCHRRNLLDRALAVSYRAFGNLPDEVAEAILKKFNTRDLLVFEAACSPSACV